MMNVKLIVDFEREPMVLEGLRSDGNGRFINNPTGPNCRNRPKTDIDWYKLNVANLPRPGTYSDL